MQILLLTQNLGSRILFRDKTVIMVEQKKICVILF